MAKTKDLFLNIIANPTMSLEDLVSVGVTSENTMLLDRASYASNEKIQNAFKDTNGNFDEAIHFLKQAKKYAIEYDKVKEKRKGKFTCLLLDHYEDDYTDERIERSVLDSWKKHVSEDKIFNILREREDFQRLINE